MISLYTTHIVMHAASVSALGSSAYDFGDSSFKMAFSGGSPPVARYLVGKNAVW